MQHHKLNNYLEYNLVLSFVGKVLSFVGKELHCLVKLVKLDYG
jgi:hypothetical protein